MAKPQRNLFLVVVPVALLAGWLAFGDSVFSQKAQSEQATAGDVQPKNNLQQAADAIVAVAKDASPPPRAMTKPSSVPDSRIKH